MTNRYEGFVDSGVPWIGEIPISWSIWPLWAMYERIKDVDHPDEQMLSVFREYGVVAKDSYENINQAAEDRSIYQLVHPGWLVTNRMKAWQGSVGISPFRGIVSGHYICFAPRHEEDHRYLNWLLRSSPYIAGYRMISRGVRPGQAEIDNDHYRLLPVVVPPRPEQKAIADYLDLETAQIDTLIAEQQKLVGMLSERRISAITEAVSGSGISYRKETSSRWYTSLPDFWLLGRVKNVAVRVTDGAHISPVTDGGVYDFVSTRDLKAGVIDFDGSLKTTPETYDFMVRTGCRPKAGDVLFSKDGTVGSTAVVRQSRDFVVASSLVIITPDAAQIDSDFLAYVFASKGAKENATFLMRGAGLPRISIANVGRIEVPLPPLDEQRRIVDRLSREVAQIDTLIAESERLIELSQERRSALITAAVTGQIDVRGEAR